MRPVPGRVTVPYWERGTMWAGGHHRGVDFAAPVGTVVRAPWSGVVTPTKWGPAYGTHLVIDFDRLPDGSPGLWGILAHLARADVKAGDRVKAGQVIGRTGATGNVTGPHLHFEVQAGPSWRPAGAGLVEASRNPQPWIDAQEAPVTTPPPYRNINVATRQVIPFNEWTTLDLGPVDAITPPVGSNDWWVQLHLALATSTVPRNDIRYVKGRWARKIDGATDDTHGTDTKAVSADIPKDSWQGAWSTDMKGLVGVPVEFEVYVGAIGRGSVVSPMRLFTIDDETT